MKNNIMSKLTTAQENTIISTDDWLYILRTATLGFPLDGAGHLTLMGKRVIPLAYGDFIMWFACQWCGETKEPHNNILVCVSCGGWV